MLELGLSVVGCALLCYTLGRHNRIAVLRRWHFVLNLPARRAVAALGEKMALDQALARQALAAAARARDAGRLDDAADVLKAALGVLEEAGADRRTRLAGMRAYSRMVRAMKPVSPPPPQAFRSQALRWLARVTRALQTLLVGGGERFRLWLLMLGYGVKIVLHGARRSSAVVDRSPERRDAWDRFANGLDDFEALDASHLTAFEALSASLAAIEAGTRVRIWDTIVNP